MAFAIYGTSLLVMRCRSEDNDPSRFKYTVTVRPVLRWLPLTPVDPCFVVHRCHCAICFVLCFARGRIWLPLRDAHVYATE